MRVLPDSKSGPPRSPKPWFSDAGSLVEALYRFVFAMVEHSSTTQMIIEDVFRGARGERWDKGRIGIEMFRLLMRTWRGALLSGEADRGGNRRRSPWGRDNVLRLLRFLPPIQRAALILADIEGFRYTQVAWILDLPVEQMRALLGEARKTLRTRFQAEGSVFENH
jgi:hypothetical protein